MIRDMAKWEEPENEKYFSHTRNNGDNYYDPASWDIAEDTPKELIISFYETMKDAEGLRKLGIDI